MGVFHKLHLAGELQLLVHVDVGQVGPLGHPARFLERGQVDRRVTRAPQKRRVEVVARPGAGLPQPQQAERQNQRVQAKLCPRAGAVRPPRNPDRSRDCTACTRLALCPPEGAW
ncbi:hypothetical protein D3C79_758150 [compost metagenome]